MGVAGLEVVLRPSLTVNAVLFLAMGASMGTCSGLTPGLHANNFALLLAALAPALPGRPLFAGIAMLAAGVVHTFLDIVPALAIGVPDAEMAVAALPGHRLVIDGRGFEALRLSALGSGLAVLVAIPLAVPITLAMIRVYPLLQEHLPIIIGAVAVMMLATERTRTAVAGGLIAFIVSSAFGFVVLDLEPAAPLDGGGVLAPVFAGLFGVPVILDAMDGGGVPPQSDPRLTLSPRGVGRPAVAGAGAGALVGYLPGVSSAIAAVAALLAIPGDGGDRAFVIATSGVNTANTIFALFALVALGTPRTGVMVAVSDAEVPLNLPVLLMSVAIAAAYGFTLVIVVGDRYLVTVGDLNYTRLSAVVLVQLTLLSFLFAGPLGILILAASTIIGQLPVRFGAKRVHLMGVLMGPIMHATWVS